jgi:hypothetical protein
MSDVTLSDGLTTICAAHTAHPIRLAAQPKRRAVALSNEAGEHMRHPWGGAS